jgi:hypothetical protein
MGIHELDIAFESRGKLLACVHCWLLALGQRNFFNVLRSGSSPVIFAPVLVPRVGSANDSALHANFGFLATARLS